MIISTLQILGSVIILFIAIPIFVALIYGVSKPLSARPYYEIETEEEEPEYNLWECQYCNTQNIETVAKCSYCSAPRR